MSRTLEILIALTCGVIVGKFLLMPLLEIWVDWRYEKNMRSVKEASRGLGREYDDSVYGGKEPAACPGPHCTRPNCTCVCHDRSTKKEA